MPVCICPECSKSHKIPPKNLGLKGRCTQCRAIFTLVEQKEEPPPAPTPAFVPVDDESDAIQNFEAETFSLRLPEPPAPPAAPASAPGPPASEQDEFDWSDEIEPEAEEPPSGRVAKIKPRGEVEPLPRRLALEIIARWLWFIAMLEITCSAFCIVAGLLAVINSSKLWQVLIGSGVSGLVSGVIILGMSEALSMARAIEQRLHEISKNVSR